MRTSSGGSRGRRPASGFRPAVLKSSYNVLSQYGGYIDHKQPLALSFGQFVLPPGDYTLEARLSDGWGRNPSHVVSSRPVRFRILPPSAFPEETKALDDFVASAHFPSGPAFLSPEGVRIAQLCGERLPAFYRSRYLMLLYYASKGRTAPPERMLASMTDAGVPEIRRASIFWERCKLALFDGAMTADGLRSLHGRWLEGRLALVRDTWVDRAVQVRPRAGPGNEAR